MSTRHSEYREDPPPGRQASVAPAEGVSLDSLG